VTKSYQFAFSIELHKHNDQDEYGAGVNKKVVILEKSKINRG